MAGKKKIVCMCQQGNCRSVAMAYLLKDYFNVDAVAIGYNANGQEVKELLFAWADHIVVMEQRMLAYVPSHFHHKTSVCDVGRDRYFTPPHNDLLSQCQRFIQNDLKITQSD